MGGDVGEPLPEQLAFYGALDNFRHPVEFFAAQQFTVETQSLIRNEQALKTLDPETAEMFEEHINPDEHFHVKLGEKALLFYCDDKKNQDLALNAARFIRELHRGMSKASRLKMEQISKVA